MVQLQETSSVLRSFVQAPSAETHMTHRFGEVQLIPRSVIRCFGESRSGDEFKISREWVFTRGESVFTLYHWKSTNLYDSDMWTPEELWASGELFDFHVGSREPATETDVAEFIAFLLQTTAE